MKARSTRPFFMKGLKITDIFGVRSTRQLRSDLRFVMQSMGSRFQIDASSVGHLRPDLSLPAYAGKIPKDGRSPIMNLFDRTGGGKGFSQRISKNSAMDFRGGTHSYDEHDGVDFVCPVGIELVAAAPGHIVAVRDRWLRGGLTVILDHGSGLITQYTHCYKLVGEIGMEVKRGNTIAISGASGIDMTTFFPWVAPHVHFMVWDHGSPVDPFLADGEYDRPGTWLNRNRPGHAQNAQGEMIPALSDVDEGAVDVIIDACKDEQIIAELDRYRGNYPALAAVLEDSLHHDAYAWPEGFRQRSVRPGYDPSPLKLTLPLTSALYAGCYIADKSE